MADLYLQVASGFQTILLPSIIAWALWAFLKHFVIKHPLHNIPGPPSPSFLTGNLAQTFDPQGWEFHKNLVETFGGVTKLQGFVGYKDLYVCDPKALHHLLVKDILVYEPQGWIIRMQKLIFGDGLLSTLGEQHKKQRKMLNPVFSPSHLRDMMPTFYEVSYKFRDAIASRLKGGPQDIDIFHWTTRTALELIGQSGLGYSFDNLDDGPANEYSTVVKNLTPTIASPDLVMILRGLLPYIDNIGSPAFRRFLVKLVPYRRAQKLREIVDIMEKASVEIFQSKKAALQLGDEALLKQVGRGKDIMSILLKANMRVKEDDPLTESELLGQMTTLIFAAMDTTSSALARTLHTLAQHTDAQRRLRQEITDSRASGSDLDYNHLMALPYLDAVIRETLRLFPPITFISREARQDIILPLRNPIIGNDGTEVREIIVPKNTHVMLSIVGANQNRDTWGQDASEWKPERWMSPLPGSVTEAHIPGVYANMMTFSDGGRACLGFKFSELEMKVVLSLLLESFSFSLTEKEIVWNLTGVTTPTVKGSGKLQLPLRVTPVRST